MRLAVILFTALCAIWFACSKESPPEPTAETFSGELVVEKGFDSVGGEYTDTISFILDETYYTLFFVTRRANLCDSEGKVTGFGRPLVKFTPSRTFGSNCDSARVPHGSFDAVFYGDTAAVLTQTDYDLGIRYELRLRK